MKLDDADKLPSDHTTEHIAGITEDDKKLHSEDSSLAPDIPTKDDESNLDLNKDNINEISEFTTYKNILPTSTSPSPALSPEEHDKEEDINKTDEPVHEDEIMGGDDEVHHMPDTSHVADDHIEDMHKKPEDADLHVDHHVPEHDPFLQNHTLVDEPTVDDHFDQFPQSPYGQDYEDENEEQDAAFGPGTCRYGGKVYVSAQQIPRDDPCDFCFCFRSDIICLQQSCPPPIRGCHEEPISGFCCPRLNILLFKFYLTFS